jgi:hypothetical protein
MSFYDDSVAKVPTSANERCARDLTPGGVGIAMQYWPPCSTSIQISVNSRNCNIYEKRHIDYRVFSIQLFRVKGNGKVPFTTGMLLPYAIKEGDLHGYEHN